MRPLCSQRDAAAQHGVLEETCPSGATGLGALTAPRFPGGGDY